jgi:deferrochelatase/peroxidase EfeB
MYEWKFPVSVIFWVMGEHPEVTPQDEERLEKKLKDCIEAALVHEGFRLDEDNVDVQVDVPRRLQEIEPEWEPC